MGFVSDRSVHEGRSTIAVAIDLLSRNTHVHTAASSFCAPQRKREHAQMFVHACTAKTANEEHESERVKVRRRRKRLLSASGFRDHVPYGLLLPWHLHRLFHFHPFYRLACHVLYQHPTFRSRHAHPCLVFGFRNSGIGAEMSGIYKMV